MLRRASYSVDDETHDIELAVKCLKHTLGLPLDPADPMARRKPLSIHQICKRIALSSQALKTEIGSWLRDTYASTISRQEHYLKEAPGASRIPDINSPNLFHAVRAALEAAQDYGMLADLLTSLAKVASDAELLASVGDTVNRHLPLFGALGAGTAARNLFDNLYCRLRVIVEEQGVGARPLLASLVSLAPRFPGNDQLAAQLRHDLLLSDRNHPVDACSPVSDITGGGRLLQSDDAGDVQEEMEKLLTSGTSLDRNTMEKLFRMVIQRLQASWWSTTGEDGANANEKQRTYCVLLARLRAYDMQAFDLLLGQWVLFLRSYPARPPLSQIFPLFASVGCLNMAAILKTASLESVPGPGSSWPAQLCQLVQQTVRTRYLQEVLHLVLTPVSPTTLEGLLTHEECYRFSILQDQAQRECARELLGLVRAALVEYSLARRKQQEGEDDGSKSLPLDWPGTQDHLLSVLRLLVLKDAAGVARVLTAPRGGAVGNSSAAEDPDVGVAGWVDALTTRLLMPDLEPGPGMRAAQHDEQQPMPPVTFDRLLGLTDDFTLPFCQVKLSLMISGLGQNGNISPVIGPSQSDGQSQQQQQQQYFDLFATAVDAAINAGSVSWTGMLSSMSPELTQHLKTRAQARFLSLVPSPSGQTLVQRDHVTTTSIPLGPGDEISTAQRQKLNTAQNLLAVINAINNGSGIQATAASTHPPVAPPTSMQGASSAGIGRPQQHPPQPNNQQPHASLPQSQLSSALADKLVDTWELLVELAANGSDESTGTSARQKHRQRMALLVHWIPLLLTFVTMHLSHGGAGATTYAGDSNSGSNLAGSKPFSGVPGVGAHNANDETRARALVACAGLLQELEAVAIFPLGERDLKDEAGLPPHQQQQQQEDADMMDTTDDFQHSEQEYTATRTGVEDGDNVTSLAKTDVDVRTLTNRIFDIACLLADNLTEDARLACARALMLVRDSNPQSHVTSSPTVASGPTGVSTICDARLRYLMSVPPPSALGDNTMLSHRDKSILPGQGNSASGGQQGKVAGVVPGTAAMGAPNLQSPAMPLPLTPGGNLPSGSMNSYFNSGGHVSTMPASSANGGNNNNGSSNNNSASAPTSAPAPTGNNNAAAASLAPSFPASHIYIGLNVAGLVPLGSSLGWIGPAAPADARLAPFHVRRWEMLNDPTPNVGENDTALNLGLFEARKVG